MVRRLALIAVLLLATLSIVWNALFAPRVLPRLRMAPGFGLHDPSGQLVSSDSLRGQILVVTFGNAECGVDCASRGQLITTAVAGMETTGRVELIWIASELASREQLAALSETLARHGQPWTVLGSSNQRELDLTLSGFRVPRRPDGTVDPLIVVVDPLGIVRAEYRIAPSPAVLTRDLAALEREIRESRGVRRYLYEAAHLFRCYV
ncbi:SCO family protein [Thermomicrobium sp.]